MSSPSPKPTPPRRRARSRSPPARRRRSPPPQQAKPPADPLALVDHTLVPEFMREPFVLGGYRPPVATWALCLRSLGRVHNQTGEIVTHAVPLVLYSAVGVATLRALPPDATATDHALLALYFVGVAVCFGASALYHTSICHADVAMHDAMYVVDRLGIIAPFVATMVFLSYYGFTCHAHWQTAHIAASLVAGGLMALLVLAGHDHARHAPTWLRVSASVAMFSVGLWTMAHLAVISPAGGWAVSLRFLGTYAAYGMGMVFYVTRFPECAYPGRFDYVGKSHQVWHAFVVLGACNLLPAVLDCYALSRCAVCEG